MLRLIAVGRPLAVCFCVGTLALSGCYLHYTSVRSKHPDYDHHVGRRSFQPLPVDFQHIDSGDHFRAITGEGKVARTLEGSRVIRVDHNSNLMLRIESETRTPKALTGFWPVCLTLGLIPIIQPTEHDANFVLYDKTTGEVLSTERYEVRDRLIFGWLSLPGALLAPIFRSVYIKEDHLSREFAVERFLGKLQFDLMHREREGAMLRDRSARRIENPPVRLAAFATASGQDLLPIVRDTVVAGLRRRGVTVSESGWPLEVIVHRRGTVGASGRHERLEMTATLYVPGSTPSAVRFHTFLAPHLLSEKLAGIVKALLFQPGRRLPLPEAKAAADPE